MRRKILQCVQAIEQLCWNYFINLRQLKKIIRKIKLPFPNTYSLKLRSSSTNLWFTN